LKLGGIYEADYPLQLLRTRLVLGKNETNMTAIAVVATPEGFVIGADGLRQTTLRSVTTDKAQKVFGFKNQQVTLAYAWCGQIVFWNEDNRTQIFFDFGAVTNSVLALASLLASDLSGFAESLRTTILDVLTQSNRVYPGWISAANPGKMARMLAVGYFGDEPFLLEIEVQQVNSLPFVSVRRHAMSNDLRVLSGYAPPDEKLKRVPADLADARNLVHEYIQKASNNSEIGGRIHVALVSRDSVRWIDEPEILPSNL
jgi:hypothetical protein